MNAVEAEEARRIARGERWRLRDRMGKEGITRLNRVAHCGKSAVDWYVPVLVKDGVASFGGVITCGSVSACVVCSAKIRQEKAAEVEWRAKAWLADGGGLLFVTLTLPHTMADDLGDLLDGVLASWRGMQQDHQLRGVLASLGYRGPLRSLEVTHGWNGWHPHLHLLLWFDRPLARGAAALVESAFFASWERNVRERLGRSPSRAHGVKSERVGLLDGAAVAAYLVKVQDGFDDRAQHWSAAKEMTRGDLKKGRKHSRTPFEIALAAVEGDKGAAALWRRYEASMKGRRVMQWGQKLYGHLKAVQVPPEDDAGQPVVALELSRPDWNALRTYNRRLRLLVEVERRGALGGLAVIRTLHRRVEFEHQRGRSRTPVDLAVFQQRQVVSA
ncbi:MAG: hypothetical protein QOJ92_238 [Frankiales bacterium]|nr:hypothetical protein [Frankiales bacterium]